MSKDKDSKQKALQLTLDKLDKTYGKGTVMKMGDAVAEEIESISTSQYWNDRKEEEKKKETYITATVSIEEYFQIIVLNINSIYSKILKTRRFY